MDRVRAGDNLSEGGSGMDVPMFGAFISPQDLEKKDKVVDRCYWQVFLHKGWHISLAAWTKTRVGLSESLGQKLGMHR